MYYYNARYYDPHLGSFLTPDPGMSGLNHYAYANSNPIRYTDPTGLLTVEEWNNWVDTWCGGGGGIDGGHPPSERLDGSYYYDDLVDLARHIKSDVPAHVVGYIPYYDHGGSSLPSIDYSCYRSGSGTFSGGENRPGAYGADSGKSNVLLDFPNKSIKVPYTEEGYKDRQIKDLNDFIQDIKKTGKVDGINLRLNTPQDGCFTRAYLMGESLKNNGFNVKYAEVNHPTTPDGFIFEFHTAPIVTLIDGSKVVIDPMYSTKTLTVADWANIQNKTINDVIDSLTLPENMSSILDTGGSVNSGYNDIIINYTNKTDFSKQFLDVVYNFYKF